MPPKKGDTPIVTPCVKEDDNPECNKIIGKIYVSDKFCIIMVYATNIIDILNEFGIQYSITRVSFFEVEIYEGNDYKNPKGTIQRILDKLEEMSHKKLTIKIIDSDIESVIYQVNGIEGIHCNDSILN